MTDPTNEEERPEDAARRYAREVLETHAEIDHIRKLEKVAEAARACLPRIEYAERGTTHWEGCHEQHATCRLVRLLGELAGADDPSGGSL